MKKVIKLIAGIAAGMVGTWVFCWWLAATGNAAHLAACLVLWTGSMWCFAEEKEEGK